MSEIRINNENFKITTESYLKKERKPGVYVWGYYEDTTFIPLYVGKSKNLYERLLQHYCRFRGGEYCIPDCNILRDIYVKMTNNEKTPKLRVYNPFGFGHVINELPKHKAMIDLIISNFAFRYQVIEKEEDRAKAERSLANRLGRGRLITSVARGGDDNLSEELEALIKS